MSDMMELAYSRLLDENEVLRARIATLEKALLRIENGDACDGCRADKEHIRLYDNDGEFVHSCRKAIARAALEEKK